MSTPTSRILPAKLYQPVVIASLLAFLLLIVCGSANAQTPDDAQRFGQLMQKLQLEMEAGDTGKAVTTLAEVLEIGERAMGKNSADVINMRNSYSVLLRQTGDLKKAKQQTNNARRAAKRSLGANHPYYATATLNLGNLDRFEGDNQGAKVKFQEAISILEKNADAPKALADAYLGLSDLLTEMNEYAEARVFADKAMAAFGRTNNGPRSVVMASAINNYGMLLQGLGDLDGAEKKLTEALSIYEELYGKEHAEIASSLGNLALLHSLRGRYEKSKTLNEQALKIAKKTLGETHGTTANITSNLGQLLSEMGEHEQAKTLLEQALDIRTKNLRPDDMAIGITQHNLGGLFLDLKDFEKGRDHLTEAIRILDSSVGKEHQDPVSSRVFMGMLEAADQHPELATEYFDEARKGANGAAWKVLPGLNTNEQQRFMARTFDWTLFASLSLANYVPDDQQIINKTAEWLANGKGIAESALAAARTGKSDDPLEWIPLDEIRKSIPADGILIDISRQGLLDFDATSYADRLGTTHYVAWIVPAVGQIVRVDLGDAAEIEKLVESFRAEIEKAGGKGGKITEVGEIGATKAVVEKLAALSQKIWQPIEGHLPEDTKRLIFSPDGALWLVPWNAIPVASKPAELEKGESNADEAGDFDTHYLIEDYSISTVSSGRDLVQTATDQPSPKSKSAVFSNPNFDQSSSEKQSSYQRLFRRPPQQPDSQTRSTAFDQTRHRASPLPGTELESAAILPRMIKWLDGAKPDQFKGRFALESVVKQLVRPRSIVFATHGFFNESTSQTGNADPLSRCGLLFCGCNDINSAIGGDDGVLTGTEITAMDLRGTELVVLSACETGIGKIENGNGVAGLRRAFHLAGAQGVASTLWQIPDFDTAKLMSDFFDGLAAGEAKDDALRSAQIKRIASRRQRYGAAHPFFWAGFSISGR